MSGPSAKIEDLVVLGLKFGILEAVGLAKCQHLVLYEQPPSASS